MQCSWWGLSCFSFFSNDLVSKKRNSMHSTFSALFVKTLYSSHILWDCGYKSFLPAWNGCLFLIFQKNSTGLLEFCLNRIIGFNPMKHYLFWNSDSENHSLFSRHLLITCWNVFILLPSNPNGVTPQINKPVILTTHSASSMESILSIWSIRLCRLWFI